MIPIFYTFILKITSLPFTINELNYALKKRKDTAPGIDNITYSMIRHLPNDPKNRLLQCYNTSFFGGEIPKDWMTYIVLSILKNGKPEGNISNYRPIAINSCVGKVYENLIRCRLEWEVEHNKIIPWFSTGFRKTIGINGNICYLGCGIQLALSRNLFTLTVFLDMKAA